MFLLIMYNYNLTLLFNFNFRLLIVYAYPGFECYKTVERNKLKWMNFVSGVKLRNLFCVNLCLLIYWVVLTYALGHM